MLLVGPHPVDRGAHPHCRHPRVAPQHPRRRRAPVCSDLEHTASGVPHAPDRLHQETHLSADTMSIQTPRATASRSTGASRASRPFHADHEAAPLWMRAIGAALLGAGTALSAAVLAWPGDAPEVALLVPGVLGMAVGVLLLLARAGFTVTERHVTLHFRPLPPRRMPRSRIVQARLVEADATTFGGIGLRIGRGVRALLLTPGLGIELTDDRGRTTFVRTRRPEDAFRALAGRTGQPGGAVHAERERLG